MSGDKWDEIKPAGRGKRGLSGEREGAEKSKSSAAERPKRITATRAKQARQYLKEISPQQMGALLTANSSQLTHKQKTFAYHVAMGATKAEAYRTAYKRDATPSSLHSDPYRIAADPRIAREIEAYKLAQEAAKHRTPSDLRNLVIQSLTQQIIDPETPPAVRTMAIKTLGQVTEVAAFTERKESVVHHTSDKLRADIFAQVQALMSGKTIEGERVDQDAASLLAELTVSSITPDSTPESDREGGTESGSDSTEDGGVK